MKTNLPALRHTASTRKRSEKHVFFALPVRTDHVFPSRFKKGSDGAMTAKCTMIYLYGEWLVNARCDRKYLFFALAHEWNTRNPICSSSFHIPFNLCLRHSLVNKLHVCDCGYASVPSTLNMLRQGDFQDIWMLASKRICRRTAQIRGHMDVV